MAPKRATFLTFGSDSVCEETKKFIEDNGVLLTIRDLSKEPLTYTELKKMIGHIKFSHFINTRTPEYDKMNLDSIDDREQILNILAENNSLLLKPIIRTPRLTTIGCNKKKISEMLQLTGNGSDNQVEDAGYARGTKYVTRRQPGSKPSEKSEQKSEKASGSAA